MATNKANVSQRIFVFRFDPMGDASVIGLAMNSNESP